MCEILNEAGWPIFLVLAFGGTALLLSIRHAVVPDKNNLTLIVGLGTLALLWGALGTAVGLQHAIRGLGSAEPDFKWLVWVGLREALNNFSSALSLDILAAVFALVGAVRLNSRTAP